jgi:hypothetical protein
MNICFDFHCFSLNSRPLSKLFPSRSWNTWQTVIPDIIPELKLIIEERWPHETPAFHSRARKILKKFK